LPKEEKRFEAQEMGGKASPEQVKELQAARKVFEVVRPYGSQDAEAAYKKNPEDWDAPYAPFSSKPSCGPIPADAPNVLF
jgi:hypothetical protein